MRGVHINKNIEHRPRFLLTSCVICFNIYCFLQSIQNSVVGHHYIFPVTTQPTCSSQEMVTTTRTCYFNTIRHLILLPLLPSLPPRGPVPFGDAHHQYCFNTIRHLPSFPSLPSLPSGLHVYTPTYQFTHTPSYTHTPIHHLYQPTCL